MSRMTLSWRNLWQELRQTRDIDVVFAMAAFVAFLVDSVLDTEHPHIAVLEVFLALATSVPLVLRRLHPIGLLVVIVPLLLLCLADFHSDRAVVGVVMLEVFTIGSEGGRRRTLIVGALMAPRRRGRSVDYEHRRSPFKPFNPNSQ